MLVIDITHQSFIDLITNSSTEIFVIDNDQTLNFVKEIVRELEEKHPNEYGYRFGVDYVEEYDLQDTYGYMDKGDCISYLNALGYTSNEPSEPKKLIKIYAERGSHEYIRAELETMFNVIYHSTES